MVQVLAVGGIIAAIGATALFFLFRMFGQQGAGKGRHIGLMLALLAFIFVCCFILIRLSYRGQ
jgi:nitrate/nitrite transporter NarK